MIALGCGPVGPVHACVPLGVWSVPTPDGVQETEARAIFLHTRTQPVVLLGESHDNVEHHRWQLHTLAALHLQRADMVIGFEMFPRRVQDVLDRWVAGELSESEFLQRSHWAEVWGFDAAYYLPLFHFARMHRLPMVALNVERALVRRIGREGPEAVPEGEREGVGRPEPASAAYLRELHAVYARHGRGASGGVDDPAFQRFVAGQLMWDRAMAEGIHQGRSRYPGRQVVAIMGRGHTGPGAVPHQLRALGIEHTAVLLPWDRVPGCEPPEPGSVDAVFGVAPGIEGHSGSSLRPGVTLPPESGPGALAAPAASGGFAHNPEQE